MNGKESGFRFPRPWLPPALVAPVSLAELRMILTIHHARMKELVAAAWYLTLGQPHWVEYQNRLLGPWLVYLVAGDSRAAYFSVFLWALLVLTLAKNLLAFFLTRHLTGDSRKGAAAAFAGSFLFLLLQDPSWTYLWDYLDVVMFTLFLYGVLSRRGNLFFALVFIPALLNRESALFMALWLILDAFALREGTRWILPRLRDPMRLLLGTSLAAAGAVFIHLTRKALLVKEMAAALDPLFVVERPFHIARNLRNLAHALSHPGWDLLFLPYLGFLLLVVLLLLRLGGMDDRQTKTALVTLAVLSSIALVGGIIETRVFTMLIPFALLLPLQAATAEHP